MFHSLRTTLAAGCTALLLALPVCAETWQPDGPVTLKVGFGAGGATDSLSRAIGKAMETNTGWDVIVENVPGGGGLAMLSRLQAEDPDGQTLGIGVSIPVWINLKRQGDQLPFTLDSFDWMATIGRAGLALVTAADHPAEDFDALMEMAQSGEITVSTNGPAQELIMRALAAETGAALVVVPTQSGSEMIQNILGGHTVAATMGGNHVEHVKNGTMKVLAGLTPVRDTAAPEVPTLLERGLPFAIDASFYVAAPAGLPEDAHAALTAALSEALQAPDALRVLDNMSMAADNLGPEGTTQMMRDGLDTVDAILKKASGN